MTTAEKSKIEAPGSCDDNASGSDTGSEEALKSRSILGTNCVLTDTPLAMETDSSPLASDTPTKLHEPEITSSKSSETSLRSLGSKVNQSATQDNSRLSFIVSSQPPLHKTKRSSSASNDSSYERDRFKARFESFNPPKLAILTDQLTIKEAGSPEWEDISTKTKKLNITHPSLSAASETREEMPETIREILFSPLDRNSACFEAYLPCPVPEEMKFLDVREISPKQLCKAFSWYFNCPLPPTNHMFPWLHGLHPENFAQRTFFGYPAMLPKQRPDSDTIEDVHRPKLARFLMCVETKLVSSKLKPKALRNSVLVGEILQRIEFARSEVRAMVRMIIIHSFSETDHSEVDIEELTDCITRDCVKTGYMPVLVNSDPQRGISLRNFYIQVNKAATCADFIVYCSDNTHVTWACNCRAFARLLKMAQIAQDPKQASKFNVFIFANSGENEDLSTELWTIRDDTDIVSGVDAKKKTQLHLHHMTRIMSDTFNYWDADYQIKEKLETIVMTAATKLCLNVWSGNIWDYQIMMQILKGPSNCTDEACPEVVPLHECHDNYCDPEKSLLTKNFTTSAKLNLVSVLPPPRSHWKLFIHCHNDARFPSQSLLSELLFKYTITSRRAADVEDAHFLEFPSSGSIGLGDCRQENLMSIVNTCKLLYLYSSSVAVGSLASLIYCSDGYTESSLLILCFLMYAEDVSLERAMLKVHLEYGRPYYVFSTDVQVLRKLEVLLRKYSPVRLREAISWQQYETILQQEINDILLKPKRKGSEEGNGIPRRFRLGYIAPESSSESSDDSDTDCNGGEYARGCHSEKCWVEDLEGSLPSKILPYIYLGSLKHANNLAVLSKLGITKVISVGECLEWLKDRKFQRDNEVTTEELSSGKMELIHIRPRSSQHSSNNQSSPISTVLKLNNLQDDGIDDLMEALPWTLDYIDHEYKRSSGQTKFLIHCRVGVSRSATVVIAEVMSRLGLNISQAYLYVRVRRLNIVIQPNLRFVYELFKWEEKEREEAKLQTIAASGHSRGNLRVIDWFVFCQEIKKLNMPFVRS